MSFCVNIDMITTRDISVYQRYFCSQMSTSTWLTASAFSFLLSPLGMILEIATVLFYIFRDLAIVTISLVISSDVWSRTRLFVPTCCIQIPGSKPLFVGLIYYSISLLLVDKKGLIFTMYFLFHKPLTRQPSTSLFMLSPITKTSFLDFSVILFSL